MKYSFTLLLTVFFCNFLHAQNTHLYLTGGLINYQGDLQAKRITFSQAQLMGGAGLYYEATDKLYFRLGFMMGKVGADDKKSSLNQDRNLNFKSGITEFHFGAEYDIFNSYERAITPYVFAGLAWYHYNPYTLDSAGGKVFLQPLGTEGQGFFEGRKKYGLNQIAIPFGAGLKMMLSDNINLRFEACLRKLFTDYLDDVSTNIVDEAALRANNGQLAVDYAFRADELNHSRVYPPAGAKRGNPRTKDYYYTTSLSISFRLRSNEYGGRSGKGKTGCPTNVY